MHKNDLRKVFKIHKNRKKRKNCKHRCRKNSDGWVPLKLVGIQPNTKNINSKKEGGSPRNKKSKNNS